MSTQRSIVLSALVLLTVVTAGFAADPILKVGDAILAIDTDRSASWYPGAENPTTLSDGATNTKYLNFGAANTGLILTPAGGPIALRSLALSTANDAEERDPVEYAIYGTNDPVASPDNSNGTLESWTLVSQGPLSLPTMRLAAAPVVSFSNDTAYSSYRIVFPTLRNQKANGTAAVPNSMQVSELGLFSSADGTGSNALAGASLKAIDLDVLATSQSSSPGSGNENALKVLDGNSATKYLNFGRANTGVIVTPQVGWSVVESLQFTTANDAEGRDPMTFALYGTLDAISSGDHSFGEGENWTLIATGDTGLAGLVGAGNRLKQGPMVPIVNDVPYSSYKLVFTTIRDRGANSMQVADIQFFGTIIPEPATLVLLAGAAVACVRRRRA